MASPNNGTYQGLKLAYADPPYPGQAARWYKNHPDYAGEVDHRQLVDRLTSEYPDGWALSTSAAALPAVLAVCPAVVHVAVWHVTNAEHPGFKVSHWWRVWEPVIVSGGCHDAEPVRNLLACPNHSGYDRRRTIAGQKPAEFCRWVFRLLGARVGDRLDDLFPGSGAVSRAWADYLAQPSLLEPLTSNWGNDPRNIARDMARQSAPLFGDSGETDKV
jgi:hypothetical protein